jgi:hypothetical protein
MASCSVSAVVAHSFARSCGFSLSFFRSWARSHESFAARLRISGRDQRFRERDHLFRREADRWFRRNVITSATPPKSVITFPKRVITLPKWVITHRNGAGQGLGVGLRMD